MIRKGILGLMAAFGLSAFGADVWFYPSWIDGVATKYGDKIYISVVGDQYHKDHYEFTPNATLTFRAEVASGHEITEWSRGTYNSTSVATARDVGHFPEIVASTSDTLTWTMPSASQSLAVHQDWLKYGIVYAGNGATGGSMNGLSGLIYTQNVALAANTFKKTGYSFSGWTMKDAPSRTFSDGETVTGASFGLSYTNKSVALDAQWTPNEYAVIYDANGGAFAGGLTVKTNIVAFGAAYGLPPGTPSRGGYTFDQWTNSLGQIVGEKTIMQTPADHVVFAAWKSIGKLHINVVKCPDEPGADGMVSGRGDYDWGDECFLQATPSTGSKFVGWSKNAQGSKIFSTDPQLQITVEESATYYGHFALQQFTVAFQYKDAAGNDIKTNQVVKYGHDAVPPNLPARPHYRFTQWNASYQSITKDIVDPPITAIYESTSLTVRFDSNGGVGAAMADIGADEGTALTLPACTYSNGNRRFLYWLGPDGNHYVDKATISNFSGRDGNVFLLTAQWAETYDVAFGGNGATAGVMTNQTFDAGVEVTLPANAYTRTGYAFCGWATNSADAAAHKVEFKDSATVRDLAPVGGVSELVAVWTNNPYRVLFNPNGGEEVVETPVRHGDGEGKPFVRSFVYDVAQALPDGEVYVRDGYELVGWLTDPTNAVAFAVGESVSNLTTTAGAVVSLFAKWNPIVTDLGPLAEAADCDKATSGRIALSLTASLDKPEESLIDYYCYCQVVTNDTPINGGNNLYLQLGPMSKDKVPDSGEKAAATLKSQNLTGAGTLSFYYRMETATESYNEEEQSKFTFRFASDVLDGDTNITQWAFYSREFSADEVSGGGGQLSWEFVTHFADQNDAVFIDNISWKPKDQNLGTVGVTFRLNDGTVAPADIVTNVTRDVGKAIGALPTAVRPDAVFCGWATAPSGGTMIDPTWEIPAADTQLYAQWQELADVPVAIPDLVYTGTLQTGVVATAGVLLTDNAKTEAGSYEAVATLLPGCTWRDGSTHSTNIAWSIAKARYDMSGVSLTNATYVEDGSAKSLAITGTLPEGVTVEYQNNGKTAVGTYTVTAKFSGDETNYETIADLTATLKIEERPKTPVDAPVAIKGLVYNGSVQTGVVAVAGFELAVNVATNAGQYVAIATPAEGFCWTGGDTNAVEIGWEISKAVYDVSGISFTNATYLADGTAKSLVITGELPDGVTVDYEGNGQTAPGTYTVTAKFSVDAENHEAIGDKTATLTIYQLVYDMSGVSFSSASYAWDGTEKSLAVSGELPEGVTVEYVGNGQTAPGTYTVTAVFSGDAIGHAAIPDMTATLKIVMPDQLADSFPTGIKGFAYPTVSIATVWPDAAAHPGDWKISGWPSGIKFAKSNVYGTPKKVGSFTISAVRKSTGKTYTATFAVRDPLPSELPSCEIDFGGTPVDPATKAVRLYAGVKYSWPLEATAGAKVTASKLPTGMKLVKQKTAAGYAYSVAGVPKKAKQFTTTFKVKAGGLTGTPAVTFDVLPLPSWAQGQFDGGSDAGLLTLKITSAGKLNGKYQEAGIKSKLTAASYDSYDESTGVYSVSATFSGGSAGKVTRVFRVSRDEVSGYFTDGSLTARQNLWKSDWKSVAALCAKAPSTSLETAGGLVTLKPGAKGVIKATFERGGKKAKCSSVLLPATLPAADGFLADVCLDFSPKSIPDGFATVLRLRWTGETFVTADE